MEGKEPNGQPDVQPEVQGASRGQGDDRDADRAATGGRGKRAEPGNEYAANTEAGEEGYRRQGSQHDTAAADVDPHEPPGQG